MHRNVEPIPRSMLSKQLLKIPVYRHLRNTILFVEEGLLKLDLMRAGVSTRRKPVSHRLKGELIVSLTSYPERYSVLPWTLRSLLRQFVKPNRLILWIAEEEFGQLTPEITKFQEYGVEIRRCPNIASYKKIVPTLLEFPEAYIVTADDDIFYPRNWLQQLIDEFSNESPEPIAHRVHRITLDQSGHPKSYAKWWHCSTEGGGSVLNFPTSGAGVLYPPNAFHPDVTRADIFKKLCPHADDVWLYWMIRMAGRIAYNIQGGFRLRTWRAARNNQTLFEENFFGGRNDQQIRAMIEYYGLPISDVNLEEVKDSVRD